MGVMEPSNYPPTSVRTREGAVIELVLKLAALVVDAVVLDDRGDEAKAAPSE